MISSGSSLLEGKVKKATEIINARPDGDDFSLIDRKIFNYLLSNAYDNIKTNKFHRISLYELRKLVTTNESDSLKKVEKIKESLERLWRINISIDYKDELNRNRELRCHYLSYDLCHIQSGFLDYAFDPMIIDFLHDPKVYATIQLAVVAKFRSDYSLKLYEQMKLFYNRFHPVWICNMDEIYRFFNLENTKYVDRFDRFRSRILDPSIEEVNRLAEFDIQCDFQRGGRGQKVLGIKFQALGKKAEKLSSVSNPVSGKQKNTVLLPNDDLFSFVKPELNSNTFNEALEIVGAEGIVKDEYENWIKQAEKNSLIINGSFDDAFLSWLSIKHAKSDDFSGIDIDSVFSNLLSEVD